MATNTKYSFKDFLNKNFKDIPVEEFNNTEIIGSCFYQECLEDDENVIKDIFPDGMTGVIFKRCNLDNVLIPDGNTIETEGEHRCSVRKLKVQNDLMDWILDDNLKPVEPTKKRRYIELDISIDPAHIPTPKMLESIIRKKERELEE